MSSFTDLQALLGPENVTENYPLGEKSTFRAGGSCRYFLEPAGEEKLSAAVAFLREREIPLFLFGRGSNILVSDQGFPGAVISLRKHFSGVSAVGCEIEAGSGTLLSEAAKAAFSASLTGLEFASGIPGTVGGGIRMNAGAYGGELGAVTRSVRLLLPSGEVREVPGTEMDFSYRHSLVESLNAAVLSAVFSLKQGEPEKIREKMEELNRRRREKQPLEYGSAGSTFKRPEGYYAGALIEAAGLKGYRLGQAGVSEKHAGFVINYGGASASEIYSVIRHVEETVEKHAGVLLEREVLLLGEF